MISILPFPTAPLEEEVDTQARQRARIGWGGVFEGSFLSTPLPTRSLKGGGICLAEPHLFAEPRSWL